MSQHEDCCQISTFLHRQCTSNNKLKKLLTFLHYLGLCCLLQTVTINRCTLTGNAAILRKPKTFTGNYSECTSTHVMKTRISGLCMGSKCQQLCGESPSGSSSLSVGPYTEKDESCTDNLPHNPISTVRENPVYKHASAIHLKPTPPMTTESHKSLTVSRKEKRSQEAPWACFSARNNYSTEPV